MQLLPIRSLFSKNLKLQFITIYPILIIILIPSLLIFNTFWNLKAFNRDANFIVRHQAVSIADTIKPQIKSLDGESNLKLFSDLLNSNSDLISISLFKKNGDEFELLTTTLKEGADALSQFKLNQLAIGFEQPVAALTYNPNLARNIWNVVVPVEESGESLLLTFQLDTKSVNEILNRTSRDSLLILVILVIVTIALTVNHFYFYLRSMRTSQLEELDRLKDEFISMAAHELRAPITAITGYLDLLKEKITSGKSDSVAEEIDVISGLTKDLNVLVEDLLDVSRIEQGRIKIEPKPTNILEVVDKVVLVLKPMTQQKGLTLVFVKSEVPEITTDPERLRQIVTNLISNSIKYTLKGSITVSVAKESDVIKVSVKDTGIGIPADQISKLFGKFHRVKDERTREVKGTGLGLWITKQLVELLGGRIYAESTPGSGSSFSFTVPIRSSAR